MRVLVACEFSGVVRNAFINAGHDAMSCDLLPADQPDPFGNDDCHYQGDIFQLLADKDYEFDLMIAHPPCTFLTNSGVCHLYTKAGRWAQMIEAAVFFRKLLNAKIPKKALENPIMHGYAKNIIGRGPDQIIQPHQFGHMETKATGLHLEGLPLLKPTTNLKAETMALPANQRMRLHYLPPSANRAKLRSTTFQGIADAMADQWGHL